MDISISQDLVKAIGLKKLQPFGFTEERAKWRANDIDLTRYPTKKVRLLHTLLTPHTSIKGTRAALRDITIWLEAAEHGADGVRCRNTKQFASLVHAFLQAAPRHRLYKKGANDDPWVAYYVGSIKYTPPQQERYGGYTPARTDLALYYEELGCGVSDVASFENGDVSKRTVPEALAAAGFVIETDALRAEYEALTDRYREIHDKIGRQFLAGGVGTDNLDGNPDSGRWYRHSTTLRFERDGAPSRVVIDKIQESDEKRSEPDKKPNPVYWRAKSFLTAAEDANDPEEEIGPEDIDPEAEPEVAHVPLHPIVPVFDLRRHLRMRVHVGHLTAYPYDMTLGDKLVLPRDERRLVEMLLHHKGGFTDIVGGKGGGAIILCAGIPGTGKTLTAEVYAEVMERPLYSVQCSQLGLNADELEKELLKVFSRAQRWGAILLLDEADVYVAARGSDLTQNAIVGVFLRVLEYYNGVLFLTTNRADLVDDAIASRCIARINYTWPDRTQQLEIWHVLATVMGVTIDEQVLRAVALKHPQLTGRDIKNLIKLAIMVSAADGKAITLETIDFVKRFKPTEDARGCP